MKNSDIIHTYEEDSSRVLNKISKSSYSTPFISVEKLVKQDVLCESSDTDNSFVSFETLLDYLFNGEW